MTDRAQEIAGKCRTCGAKKREDNMFCSDGFHAPPLKAFTLRTHLERQDHADQ